MRGAAVSQRGKNAKNISSQDIIERFIRRARRVEAHSLVKSGDIERYSKPFFILQESEEGTITLKWQTCENEEAVESLAGRLRALLLPSESIYLAKVFKAIKSLVPGDSFTEDQLEEFNSMMDWFKHRCEEKDNVRYGVQRLDEDGSEKTVVLSDVLIAESWIYMDTVHVDLKGDKAEGRKLDYFERYKAGVSFFCEFAGVVVRVLNLVRKLAKVDLLTLPENIWDELVTCADMVNKVSLVDEVYILPEGTDVLPGISSEDLQHGIKFTAGKYDLFSATENISYITMLDINENVVAKYMAYREIKEDSFVFSIDRIGKLTLKRILSEQVESVDSVISVNVDDRNSSAGKKFLDYACLANCVRLEFKYKGYDQKIDMKRSQ